MGFLRIQSGKRGPSWSLETLLTLAWKALVKVLRWVGSWFRSVPPHARCMDGERLFSEHTLGGTQEEEGVLPAYVVVSPMSLTDSGRLGWGEIKKKRWLSLE